MKLRYKRNKLGNGRSPISKSDVFPSQTQFIGHFPAGQRRFWRQKFLEAQKWLAQAHLRERFISVVGSGLSELMVF